MVKDIGRENHVKSGVVETIISKIHSNRVNVSYFHGVGSYVRPR